MNKQFSHFDSVLIIKILSITKYNKNNNNIIVILVVVLLVISLPLLLLLPVLLVEVVCLDVLIHSTPTLNRTKRICVFSHSYMHFK